jgi:short-subunit dehydrogenase
MEYSMEVEMGTIRGKALVTGASSGIGRETTRRLSQEGFQVIASARRKERLDDLVKENQNILPRPVDLSDAQELEKFCQEIANLAEPISVLINNAGFSVRGAVEDVSLASIRRLFEVNLFALVRVTQACLPGMRRLRRGRIINLSSVVGKFPYPTSGPYAATKHAVEAITDALRMEVRPFGIYVVTIRPGVIGTEFNEVANKLTGDLLSRTHPDYKPVYQAYGAAMGKLFSNIIIPGPEIIASLILEAVLSDSPKAAYCAGPMVEEILGPRTKLDDDSFFQFMSEKTGLKDLKV